MANEIIRPSALPPRITPVASEVVPSDNSSTVAGVTWADGVNAAVPVSSQAEAEDGVNNSKRMTPLTTKQAIDAQVPPKISTAIGDLNLGSASQASVGDFATAAQGAKADSAVQPGVTISAGAGLTGGGTLAANRTIALNSTSIASLAKADSAVQQPALDAKANSSVTISAGTGLTGGGNLTANRTIGLSAVTQNRLMPGGGAAGQILVKTDGADYAVGWVSSEAATAVSYAAQTLDSAQKSQARTNIDALGPNETADRAFRRGNILGTVSESGGVPTGAIIESGSNANGIYVRYANGWQACVSPPLTLAHINASIVGATWTFPAGFVSGSHVGGGIGLPSAAANYTNVALRDLGATVFNPQASRENATVGASRIATATADTDANVINCYAFASGRWY